MQTTSPRTRWLALLVMMSTSFVLVTAEFLPSGLLTPMAADLGITTGQAAQTVTITAVVGFIAAPTVGLLIPRMDRRALLAWLAVAAAISNLIVAIVPSLWMMLLARMLLGAALSGFWAMSLATAVRLSRPEQLGRAVMIVTLGVSVATVAGVPTGVILGEAMGWRAAFVAIAAVTAVVAVLLRLVLPPVPAAATTGLRVLTETLRRPGVPLGLTGHLLTVLGHFTAYTFIRVAIEQIDGVDATSITVLLALFGAGGFVGNLLIGILADRHLPVLSYAVPALTAGSIAVVALGTASMATVGVAVTLWGASFGGWLILVNAWTSREVPDRLEAGGALVVAGFQLAITLGAAVGGLLVDNAGIRTTLLIATGLLVFGSATFGEANRRLARRVSGAEADSPAGEGDAAEEPAAASPALAPLPAQDDAARRPLAAPATCCAAPSGPS